MTTSPGAIVDGRFVLRRTLGQGASAVIWVAHDLEAKRDVALKLLSAEKRVNDRARERFSKEAAVLVDLEHRSIARAIAFALDRAQPYIAMELIQGWTLDEELRQRAETGTRFTTEDVLTIFSQLTSAIGHAHARGIVHRDLKPTNVMIDSTIDRWWIKVLDFGIAKLVETSPDDGTTHGRLLGTLAYMAPEQARGEGVDARTDIFALGVLLFEMLALTRAWFRGTDGGLVRYADNVPGDLNWPLTIVERIAIDPRPKPSAIFPELAPVDEVVARATSADSEDRFASADEMMDALREALGGSEELFAKTLTDATGPVPDQHTPVIATVPAKIDEDEASTVATERRRSPLTAQATAVRKPRAAILSPLQLGLLAAALAVTTAMIISTINTRERAEQQAARAPEVSSPVQPPVIPKATPLDPPREIQPPKIEAPREVKTKVRPAQPREPAEAKNPAHGEMEELRAELAALAKPGATAKRFVELGDRIAREAGQVSDPAKRARIERLAKSNAALGDLEGLESALRELEDARN